MKTFGEISRKEQLDLFEAWLDGKTIEQRNPSHAGTGFLEIKGIPCWNKHRVYRVAVTKPYINWDHVSKEYNWLATDADGMSYLYDTKPTIDLDLDIFCHRGSTVSGEYFTSLKAGNCSWRESLVERPCE